MNELKLIINKKNELLFENNVIKVESKNILVRDIFNHESLEEYHYSTSNQSIQSLGDLYQLDIKINEVGKISFFFQKDGFDKDKVIEKISSLKSMPVLDTNNKIDKLNKLLEIVSNEIIVFAVFKKDENCEITSENISKSPINLLFVEKGYNSNLTNKSQNKFVKFLELLWQEKLYFIFLIIAGIIIAFSLSIGIYNCYPNNAIYIFFFICTLLATVLNLFIYKDMFKKYKVLSAPFYSGIVFNILGLAGGYGIYIAYHKALKDIPEVIPNLTTLLTNSILIGVSLLIISIGGAILIKTLRKKKQS